MLGCGERGVRTVSRLTGLAGAVRAWVEGPVADVEGHAEPGGAPFVAGAMERLFRTSCCLVTVP